MPSLRDYRQRFAKHVGVGLLAGLATGGSPTYLEDTRRRSSLSIGDDLVEWYLHRTNPTVAPEDRVRLVAQVDMDNGWFYGDFPPGDRWTTAPIAGDTYELLSPEFHPVEQIHDYLNEALKFCLIPAEVTVPHLPMPGRQPVTDFVPWLTTGQNIYRVGMLSGTASREVANPYVNELRGTPEESGGSVFLRLDGGGFGSGVSVGTLAAPLTLAATTATITPSAGMPTSPPFYLTADTELLRVTTIVGSTYSLDRGVSTTPPLDHVVGTVVMAPAQYVIQGLFPAWAFCRPASGVFGSQQGLVLDTDEAPAEVQWVVAGALQEAWLSSPQTLEQLAAKARIDNLQQASLAFARWQAVTKSRMGVNRTFFPLNNSIFNVGGAVR